MMMKNALHQLERQEFIYLIQDFEPGFNAWSAQYAQALETYGLSFRAIINENFLARYLVKHDIGKFGEAGFLERCVVFEPALDRAIFRSDDVVPPVSQRTLLFYARPFDQRNMTALGYGALLVASADPLFLNQNWQFLAIGDPRFMIEMPLAAHQVLSVAPWNDYAGYAKLLRRSNIMLCPMMSPHTSYPVLEMVACGGVAVTNTFDTKTAAALSAISNDIIGVAPTVEALAEALVIAAHRSTRSLPATAVNLPSSWSDALEPVLNWLNNFLHEDTEPVVANVSQPGAEK
jgi:hypothetical protein